MGNISVHDSLIIEYERVLAGINKRLNNHYLQGNKYFKENNAKTCIRYAFKNILGLTGAEALLAVNDKLLRDLHLLSFVRLIDFPYGLDKKSYFVLIFKAFPEEFNNKKEQFVLYIYKNIIKGDMHIPVHFFDGEDGRENAAICLNYCLSFTAMDIKEQYEFFATKEGVKFLRENKLIKPLSGLYRTPLDFFHYSLPYDKRDPLLYDYCKFLSNFNMKKVFTYKGDRYA